MQELTEADLEAVTGGGAAWDAVKRWGGRVAAPLRVASTISDTRDGYNQARAEGHGRFNSALRGAGAGFESATWPLVPLAREAFSARPAY